MADLFDFMMGKKDNKKDENSQPSENKQNYAIFMPVGIYDGSQSEKKDLNKREDVNFYNMSQLEHEEQLIALRKEIVELQDLKDNLNLKIVDMKNNLNEISLEKHRHQYISTTYRNLLQTVIKIMPYYKDIEFTGIGVPEQWKDKHLVEIFLKCIEDIKDRYNSSLKEIEDLKSSRPVVNVVPEIQNNKAEISFPNATPPTDLDIEDLIPDDFDINPGDIDIEPIEVFTEPNNVPSDISSIRMDETLNRYKEKVDDEQMQCIIETIGQTGLARIVDFKELNNFKDKFTSVNGEFSQGALSKKIQNLVDMTVLEKETINTGRKGGQEHLYSLSELGVKLYKLLFSATPVPSEKIAILKQHTSLEHGYFIKTVSKELEAKGYEVLTDPSDCIRKPLISNEDGDEKLRVEADLIAIKNNEEYIIECEMGTTSEADMNKKLDKLVLVCKTISFIMNNNEALNATSAKVDKWLSKNKSKHNNLKGYTFRFTTIDSLKKREIWNNKGPF